MPTDRLLDPATVVEQTIASSLAAWHRGSTSIPLRIVVGFSAGRDSTALLAALAAVANTNDAITLHAVHVHHGLSPHADDWARQAEATANALHIPITVRRVTVHATGDGVEAAARNVRYAALHAVCAAIDAPLMALAHHRGDQAETMLLQLARGAGLAGLAAMAPWQQTEARRWLWRPLLDLPRSAIDAYLQHKQLPYVDDDSNADSAYRRNALRHLVLPLLDTHLPGAEAAIARSARHIQQAFALEREIASADLQTLLDQSANESQLSIDRLQALSPARQAAALRQWLRQLGLGALSAARLEQLLEQALHARADASIEVHHERGCFRRYRSRLMFVDRSQPVTLHEPQVLHWQDQHEWRLPSWRGAFIFTPVERGGVARALLVAAPLRAAARCGGERLKLHAKRPSKTLKQWHQEHGTPPWQRADAPLLFRGEQLLYAPGLGLDCESLGEPGIAITWQADA